MELFDVNDDLFEWIDTESKYIDKILEELYKSELYGDVSLYSTKKAIDEELD